MIPSRLNHRDDFTPPSHKTVGFSAAENFVPRLRKSSKVRRTSKNRSRSGPVKITSPAHRLAPPPQAILILARIAYYEDQIANQESWNDHHPDRPNLKQVRSLRATRDHLRTLYNKAANVSPTEEAT